MNINYNIKSLEPKQEVAPYKDLTASEILSNKRLPNEEFSVYRARLKFVQTYMKRKQKGIPVGK